MPMWAISMFCTWGKTCNAIIQTSGGAAQWIRAQVGNRKVVDSRFGVSIGQSRIVSLGKRHFARTLPQLVQNIYPPWWPNLTEDAQRIQMP